MKVSINNRLCDFIPRYNPKSPKDNGWEKQNQDAFKVCKINKIDIFVKRFEKKVKYIPGYPFLVKTKNQKLPFLPMTHDLITTNEDGKEVTYLFQEVIKGKTLEAVMRHGVFSVNPHRFMRNIYSALFSIVKEGFWYTDFVEKNIFVGDDGNCYLIDLDSVAPLSILPNQDCFELSQINKNYKIVVSTYFYRDTFNYQFPSIAKNLRGDTINFLELFVFMAQLSYYLDKHFAIDFLCESTRKSIPSYLLAKNKTLTEAVFKSCFIQTKNGIHQQILKIELLNNFIQNELFKEKEMINFKF